jgi:hypothetical protein
MSHPTSRVTPGPYLILEVSIEKAVSSFMVFVSLFLASEYFLKTVKIVYSAIAPVVQCNLLKLAIF